MIHYKMKLNCTHAWMAAIKNYENKCYQLYGTPTLLIGEYDTNTLQNSWAIFHRGKHIFVYDPVISLLGVYPREVKTWPHKDI